MCQPCWLTVNHIFRGKCSPATSNSCHFCGLIKWLMRNGSEIKQKYWLGFVLKESKGTVWTRHHWELQEAALGNVERQKQPRAGWDIGSYIERSTCCWTAAYLKSGCRIFQLQKWLQLTREQPGGCQKNHKAAIALWWCSSCSQAGKCPKGTPGPAAAL